MENPDSVRFGSLVAVLFQSGDNMKKILLSIAVLSVAMIPSSLLAAPGEWWELSTKMEMEGMPFAMPGQTSKVCLPKGGQSDPNRTQGKDSNCKMTDIKHSGNTVKFKGTCVNQGETMNMAGETTHDSRSFRSKVTMTGKSGGEPVNMKMSSSGKYIGGSCDTEEIVRKARAQADAGVAAACDTSGFDASRWVSSASMFIGDKPLCTGKKDALCKVLRNDVPRDVQAFEALVQQEKTGGMPSAAKACGVNVDSMRKSLCKDKARSGPLQFLETNCPAEAKAYRERLRKQRDCEGRGFTGSNYKSLMKKCMGGEMIEEAGEKGRSARSNIPQDDDESGDSGSSSTDTVLEGAKKLKGLIGF